MPNHIEATAEHDGTLENADVRAAFENLEPSVSSPISANRNTAATVIGEDTLTVRASGDGDFTKTSQESLTGVLGALDAVDADTVEVASGGYTPDDDGDDA